MSLVKFNKRRYPWLTPDFNDFFGEDDFFSNHLWPKNIQDVPAINVKETKDAFIVELAAPGLSKDDFDINIENGYLNIFVEKSSEKEEKDDDYTRKEFNYNSFKRSLLLPENVMDEEIKATYVDGVLKFNLSKKEMLVEKTVKHIEVV